jgi:hypothetical protein
MLAESEPLIFAFEMAALSMRASMAAVSGLAICASHAGAMRGSAFVA